MKNSTYLFCLTVLLVLGARYSQAVIYVPDSTVNFNWNKPSSSWRPNSYTLYKYDGLGRVIEKKTKTGTGLNSTLELSTYTPSDKIDTRIVQYWNAITNSWLNNNKQIFLYDANQNLISQTNQTWNASSGTWVNQIQSLTTYNAAGSITSNLYKNWVTSTNTWKNSSQYFNDFDVNGNKISEIYQSWDVANSVWKNTAKALLTYKNVNKLDSSISYNWEVSTLSWKKSSLSLNNYTANGNVLSTIFKTWNSANSNWINVTRSTYGYNAAGSDTVDISENWDQTLLIWKYVNKKSFTFDSKERQLSYASYGWNVASNKFVLSGGLKNSFIDDANNNLLDKTVRAYYSPSGQYENNSKTVNHYIAIVVTTLPLVKEDVISLNVHPNPSTSGIFYLDSFVAFDVINSLGQIISTGNGTSVDLSAFPKGWYLLKAKIGQNVELRRLIIE